MRARDADASDGSGGASPNDSTRACSGWSWNELRVELTTLLGIDEHPAELAGFGYIPAVVARPLAARMATAEWRFAICTCDGVPICSGTTTHRPGVRADSKRDPKRGGVLELQLTSTQLFELSTAIIAGQHGDWAHVITDISDHYRRGILDAGTSHTEANMPDSAATVARRALQPQRHNRQEAQ